MVKVKVKFFQKYVKSQGHEVKKFGSNRKVLSQQIHMWNMKALSLGSKVMTKVKLGQK